jgi:dCMP deaminase
LSGCLLITLHTGVRLRGGQTLIALVAAGLPDGLLTTGLYAATQTVLALVCSHGSIKLDAGALSQRTKTEPKMWDPDNEKWHKRFLRLAAHIATWSQDPSTQVGCVIVAPDRTTRGTGYNGFPRLVDDSEDRLNNRDTRLALTVHAELNAVLSAGNVQRCAAYITFPPCSACATAMIQAGIAWVIFPEGEAPERWRADFELAESILLEACVQIRRVDVSRETMRTQ